MQETDMHSSLSFYEKLGEENYVKIRLFHKIMVEYFYIKEEENEYGITFGENYQSS